MVKYCCEKFNKYFWLFRFDENKNIWFIQEVSPDEVLDITDINFCPFCGKKLEDK